MRSSIIGILVVFALIAPTSAFSEQVWVGNRNGNSIAIIDGETFDIDYYAGLCPSAGCIDGPHDIAFNPAGTKAYITAYDGDRVVVIDTDNPSFVCYGNVGENPQGIVINSDGTRAYVANSHSDYVSVLDITEENCAFTIATVDVGQDPDGIAILDDDRVYVTNNDDHTVMIIDTTLDPPDVIETIEVGYQPRRVIVDDISGVGVRAYTVNAVGDNVSVIDLDDEENPIVTNVTVGNTPRGIAFYPNRSAILVANYDGFSISSVDTSDNSVSTFADSLGEKPHRIAITSDGAKAYVSNPNADQVSVFNALNGSLVEEVTSIGDTPGGIAILD